jgi:anthranilate synthase component 1
MIPPLSVDAEAFARLYVQGRAQLVWSRMADDLETPVSAFLKFGRDRKNAFLLESVEHAAWRGRYSIIGLDPDLVWRIVGEHAEIARGKAAIADKRYETDPRPPLQSLRALIAESALDIPDGLPPPAAGLFGYLGYETVRFVEPVPVNAKDPVGAPDAILLRPTVIVIFDALTQEIVLATPARPDAGVSAEAAYASARERLEAAAAELNGARSGRKPTPEPVGRALDAAASVSAEAYKARVEAVKRYVPATSSRPCRASASRRPSRCRHSRSTARSAA